MHVCHVSNISTPIKFLYDRYIHLGVLHININLTITDIKKNIYIHIWIKVLKPWCILKRHHFQSHTLGFSSPKNCPSNPINITFKTLTMFVHHNTMFKTIKVCWKCGNHQWPASSEQLSCPYWNSLVSDIRLTDCKRRVGKMKAVLQDYDWIMAGTWHMFNGFAGQSQNKQCTQLHGRKGDSETFALVPYS